MGLYRTIAFLVLCFLLLSAANSNDLNPDFKADYRRVQESVSKYHQKTDYAVYKYLASIPDVTMTNLTLVLNTQAGFTNLLAGALNEAADGLSDRCLYSTEALINGLMNKTMWSYKVFDAWGKMPSSILRDLRTWWIGSYRECIEISEIDSVSKKSTFEGQYCMSNFPLTEKLSLKLGMCMPAACNATEVADLVAAALIIMQATKVINLPFDAHSIRAWCQTPDEPYDTKAVVAIVIVTLFLFMICLGTFYDFYLEFLKRTDDIDDDDDTLIITGSVEKEVMLGPCDKLLLSFSVYTNGCKILDTKQRANSLSCLNGMRFLSMSWVILGHTLALSPITIQAIGNLGDLHDYSQQWTFMAILNATCSVDTFFLLSGLLVTYLVLKELDAKKGRLNWIMFYIHRYMRLTPAYMLVLMVYYCLLRYTGSGPMWMIGDVDQNCGTNWWTNLLYINNVVRSDKMCMGWSWYLANDMQYYIIAPFMIYSLFKWEIIGSTIVFLLTLGCIITRGLISKYNKFGPGGAVSAVDAPNAHPDDWDLLYVHPWTRIAPYTVGVYIGFLLFKFKCKMPIRDKRLRNVFVLIGWLLAAFLCISTLYGLYDPIQSVFNGGRSWSVDLSAFYNATWRFAWSVGVGWVIFACCTGYGGFVNTLLSWKAMVPLSRLTYCAYLVHPCIIAWFYYSQETIVMLTPQNVVYFFFGHLVAAYSLAFVASLMFEAPMMGLEKAVFGKFR